MIILEYLLDANEGGMETPPWIDDGGHYRNPTDFTMIGLTRDNPEFHIPSTVHRLTAQQVEDRQVAIHNVTPMIGEESSVELTEAEVRAEIQNWITLKGV